MIKLSVLQYWMILIFGGLLLDVILAKEFISYSIVSIVFLSLFVFNFNDNLKIVFFLTPSFYYFSTIGVVGNPVTYFLILLFIKYLFDCRNKSYDIYNLIFMVLVLVLSVISSIIGNSYNLLELVRWSMLFVFTVLLMSEKRSNRNFLDFGKYFIIGFFVSSIVGLVAFKIGGNLYDLNRTDYNPNIINRFSGLSGDPNYYGMYALLVLTFIFMQLEVVKEPKKAAFMWLLVISIGFLSILTVSRSLVVGFVFVILLFVFLNFRKRKNIKIFFLIVFFMILGLLVGSYYGFFDNFIHRFEYSTLSDLTGARSIIFFEYMTGFLSGDLWRYLFGSGVTGHPDFYFYDVNGFNSRGDFYKPFATHNTFVELLVSFGILGSVVFLVLLYRCIFNDLLKSVNGFRIFDLMPLLIIVIYFFSLHNLSQYGFYFILVLVSMFLKYRNEVGRYN